MFNIGFSIFWHVREIRSLSEMRNIWHTLEVNQDSSEFELKKKISYCNIIFSEVHI